MDWQALNFVDWLCVMRTTSMYVNSHILIVQYSLTVPTADFL